MTSSSGSVTDTYAYDAFGAIRTQTGASAQPFRFTGEQQDPDVNRQLYYLRARYYDPALGRFWSRDPLSGYLGAPKTQNAYPYVMNNPAAFIDPSGMRFSISGVVDAVVPDSVADAAGRAWDASGAAVTQCAIWGTGGFIGGGVAGAGVGCAAGAGAVIAEAVFGPNPYSECIAWGANGFFAGAGYAGAVIGCVTGAASYYAPDSELLQCGVWLLGGFSQAKVAGRTGSGPIRAGIGGCIPGGVSARQETVYAGDGKE